jgi:toxin ParE1/3/4
VAGLTWSIRASRELQTIAEYIGIESEIYAKQVAKRAIMRALLLRDHPRQGRKLPEYEGAREIRGFRTSLADDL